MVDLHAFVASCELPSEVGGTAMCARITINMSEAGELEIWLNEEGRDLLVRELKRLSERSDHVRLAPEDMGDVELSNRPYRDTDNIIEWGKVMFRPDAWDERHFPHVLGPPRSPPAETPS